MKVYRSALLHILFVLATIYSVRSQANDLCSSDLLSISEDGRQVQLTAKAREIYNLERRSDLIVLKAHGKFHSFETLSEGYGAWIGHGDVLQKVELDQEGRASKVIYTNGMAYDLAYKNGQCFRKAIRMKDHIHADAELCIELQSVLRQYDKGRTASNEQISKLFSRFNVDPKISVGKDLGIIGSAGVFVGRCLDDSMINRSLSYKPLWAEAKSPSKAGNDGPRR